ncbi:hypothetical protein ACFQ44_04610 [Levilactobacillus lanxiensis]|uniref:Uncharacterized protein n=1 Tax=Levilactobacillus lanxiensis TaxID=2799568 RepID=A0ABW4D0C1_9LACO|nr:hypothetical protein [Levilactobacillus lanxiensis]
MNKVVKLSITGLLTVSFGTVSLSPMTFTAFAKTKAAKVVSSKKLAKTRYQH